MPKEKNKRHRKIRGLGQAVKIDKDTWEYEDHTHFDVTLTRDKRQLYVDIFDATVKDNNEAHIASEIFGSIEEAEQWIDEMCALRTVWIIVEIFEGALEHIAVYDTKEIANDTIQALAKKDGLAKESENLWTNGKRDIYLREENLK